jgi:hypothetical protein
LPGAVAVVVSAWNPPPREHAIGVAPRFDGARECISDWHLFCLKALHPAHAEIGSARVLTRGGRVSMRSCAFLLAGAFLLASAAFASTTPSATAARPAATATNQTMTGTVAEVGAIGRTFKIKGTRGEVTFDPGKTIEMAGADGAALWSDLKVGDKVSVTYHLRGSSLIATKISIRG